MKWSGSSWDRVRLKNVKTSVASIGRAVKTRKPAIHGEMKSRPWRASRRARGLSLVRCSLQLRGDVSRAVASAGSGSIGLADQGFS
jgi:hypothetical protein